MPENTPLTIGAEQEGQTLLAVLRSMSPGASWNDCRRLLTSRRVVVNGVLCVHEARRLQRGDTLQVNAASAHSPPQSGQLVIYHVDDQIVVVDKPAGVVSTRRPEELHWPDEKKRLAPTLDELVTDRLLPAPKSLKTSRRRPPPLLRVQRLDRDTTGVMVFARTTSAATVLIEQFAAHRAERLYHAIVHGCPPATTIRSQLVRDRGDGRRGSSPDGRHGVLAVTHLRPLETRGAYTRVECRLETGRTHQIRIHLSELGFPVCGDRQYGRADAAPRLALHAVFLALIHPTSQQRMEFTAPWPADLESWWRNLR